MKITHFYLLEDDTPRVYTRSVCQLIDQAYLRRLNIYLYCDSQAKAQQFNDDLWTFKDTRFLPHRLVNDVPLMKEVLPMCIIGFPDATTHAPTCDVLFNLTETVPSFFSTYNEVIEVVPVNEEARAASRKRYKVYQEAGYRIKTQEYHII